MSDLAVVRASILVSTVLWACCEVLKVRRPFAVEPARSLWTAGLALAVIHTVLAFHLAYAWSHDAAWDDTARRTAAVTGLAWGGGIFANYAFLAVWIADVMWWWIAPAACLGRSAAIERTRAALFFFMFLNGAVIFASNAARSIGIPAVAAVSAAWALDRRRHAARA